MNLSKKAILISSGIFISILLSFFTQIFIKKQLNSSTYAVPLKEGRVNPVAKCYDSFYAEPKRIWSVQEENYTYYQVQAQPKNAPKNEESFEFLYFRLSIYRCENLSREISGRGRLAFMPKSVAVKFAEQWYQPYFDKCLKSKSDKRSAKQQCIKIFENDFNVPPNTNEVSPHFIFTDDAIALNKLGIRTDKALVVDTYADFRKYMSKFRGPSIKPEK